MSLIGNSLSCWLIQAYFPRLQQKQRPLREGPEGAVKPPAAGRRLFQNGPLQLGSPELFPEPCNFGTQFFHGGLITSRLSSGTETTIPVPNRLITHPAGIGRRRNGIAFISNQPDDIPPELVRIRPLCRAIRCIAQ